MKSDKKITCIILSTLILALVASPVIGEVTIEEASKVETDTYFLLGMLEEYISRSFTEGSDKIEGFYWGEQFHAYVMTAYLTRISNELGLIDDLDIRRKQDLLVILHSRVMSEYLNSFYDYELSNSARTLVSEEWKNSGRGNFSYNSFEGKATAIKYSYLAGAYFRYGEDNQYRLANGQKKADLISTLLEDIGCPKPKVTVREGIPSSVFVNFEPTDELLEWFSQYPEVWAIEMVDSLVGTASDDEMDIYHSVISVLQKGKLDGCVLSVPCVVSRLSNIFGDGDTNIPGLIPEWQEALDDHNTRRTIFTSLRSLACDSILVNNIVGRNDSECWVTLTRIGFSENKDIAIALIAYGCKRQEYCGDRVVFFLNKEMGSWRITHYTIKSRKTKWE